MERWWRVRTYRASCGYGWKSMKSKVSPPSFAGLISDVPLTAAPPIGAAMAPDDGDVLADVAAAARFMSECSRENIDFMKSFDPSPLDAFPSSVGSMARLIRESSRLSIPKLDVDTRRASSVLFDETTVDDEETFATGGAGMLVVFEPLAAAKALLSWLRLVSTDMPSSPGSRNRSGAGAALARLAGGWDR